MAKAAAQRSNGRPRVLILGGGFAGMGAAQKLKDADADVVLVDKHDYHTFQPLLYQFATGLLENSAVGHALRDLVHGQENTAIHQATVTTVDLDAREVQFAEIAPLTYDYLVLGLGAEVNFFGTEGAAEHAFPMYTLPDALRLKNHVLRKWRDADREPFARLNAECATCNLPREITIPEDHYYMMGDNRGESADSREWGPVPKKWIIGKAFMTYWPPGRIGLL